MKTLVTNKRSILILMFIALVYLLSYYFIIQQPQNKITEIFFADRITGAHRMLIDRYNQLHAGKIHVVPIDFPNMDFSTNERKEVLARSLRGEGDGIDLLAVDVVWVQRFAKWCEPLSSHFSQQELARILDGPLSRCYAGKELVAVPFFAVQGVLYYREDLLKKSPYGEYIADRLKAPMTWQDFIALKKLLPTDKPFYIYPAADYEGLVCIYLEILLSLKPDYFSSIGFNFETPQAHQALRLLVQLVNEYGITPSIVTSFTEVPSYEYFIDHDGFFIRGWTSYGKDFAFPPYDQNKRQQLRMAELPYPQGGRPASMLGGWNVMISKFSTKKEAVVDFVKFLLQEDSQEVLYTQSGYFPVVKTFYDDTACLAKYPELGFMKQIMKNSVQRPLHKDYTKYSSVMSYCINLAIKKKMSVDRALQMATTMIQNVAPAAM